MDEETKGRKIYILPNMLTTMGAFCGFYSIISAINQDFTVAAIAIIVASVFDFLDGRVARLTGTCSEFGKQYDSLCDLISFGMAPAILAYLWVLHPYGRYGWLAAFGYVATTALRLSRFNIQEECKESSNYFTGLPCPAAAGMISVSVLFLNFAEVSYNTDLMILILMYLLAYFMVSNHKYLSFKHPETTKSRNFQFMVCIVLIFVLLATVPQVTLFFVGLVYVLSAPAYALYKKVFRKVSKISKKKWIIFLPGGFSVRLFVIKTLEKNTIFIIIILIIIKV